MASFDAVDPPPCRACGTSLAHTVVDLGLSPLCETLVKPEDAHRGEAFYPLVVRVCTTCWLVQVDDSVDPAGVFQRGYPYHSSYSVSWLAHARTYVADISDRLALGPESTVVEVGSNDGYLLRWFVERGIRCLGVDPAANVAEIAEREHGVPTRVAFFGAEVAAELVAEGWHADLVCGANVMAQVPDLNDFVAGLADLVKPHGTVTIEYPHLVTLIEHTEFDTIYHEHWSYFSLLSTQWVFARHGLVVTDVEELPTHGGSLRVFARPAGVEPDVSDRVTALLDRERALGVDTLDYYASFEHDIQQVRRELLDFLFDAAAQGKQVVGYGAPGKGNTLLNHCGIRSDLLAYTVDRNPAKHHAYLPGSRIPIHPPDRLAETRPDVIVILPWNLAEEIAEQLAYTARWGAELFVPIPRLQRIG